MSKPSLVLVHGSWHSTEHFDPLKTDLEGHGFRCVPVALPSTQTPDLPPASLSDDVKAVRDAVAPELESGKNVVVVAHSFGGCVANAALKGFDAQSRQAVGASTSVIAIAFIAAIPLPAGRSFLDNLGGKPFPIHDLRTPDFAWVGPLGAHHYFYNEMPREEADKWAAKLRQQSWHAYTEKTTYGAYMDIPCRYLSCTKDQAFPYEGQVGLVAAAVAAGAKIQTVTIGKFLLLARRTVVCLFEQRLIANPDADHTPFIGRNLAYTSQFVRETAQGKEF